MRILLTGSNGQLGQAIKFLKPNFFASEELELITSTRSRLDFLNPQECHSFVKKLSPDWIINAAAYTNVDGAENNNKEALKVNRDSPDAISKALLETGGKMIHISTDFVFDGKNTSLYLPSDDTNPINFYGKSKEQGEKLLISRLYATNQIHIIRTSWLMGPIGNNFANNMINLHKNKKDINVICDQIGCPTSTFSLANFCWNLIKNYKQINDLPPILHWSDAGAASWYDVSVAVGEIGLKLGLIKSLANINPILSSQYNSIAKRPKFSILNCQLSEKLFQIKRLHWKNSLEKIMKEIPILD